MSEVAAISVSGVSKSFGATPALRRLNLEVPKGAFVALLGAAGAGKTTALRIIAGLDEPDAGEVRIAGRDVTALEPKDRDIAMIFDNLALYPNKSGFDNIAHPLKLRGMAASAMDARVRDVAGALQIGHVLGRLPKTMSGGERQRVALGRALVREPAAFLLDEPLSSLDAMLRVELRAELQRLQRDHGYTFLLATPDFTEALAVADVIVMLVKGEVRQVAGPQELYDNPLDRDVARFVGAPEINLAPARFEAGDAPRLTIWGAAFPAHRALGAALAAGGVDSFEVGVRPEHVALAPWREGGARAVITDIEPLGQQSSVTLDGPGCVIRATMKAALAAEFNLGDAVTVTPRPDLMLAFDSRSGVRIA